MDIEEIRRQIKRGLDYQEAKPGGVRPDDYISLKVPQIYDVLTLLAEVERLQAVEQAAREMREYITLRDVMVIDGGVMEAEEKLKRWDSALSVGTPTGEGDTPQH